MFAEIADRFWVIRNGLPALESEPSVSVIKTFGNVFLHPILKNEGIGTLKTDVNS